MVHQLKLRKIGNSYGIVLPREVLARLAISEGDTIVLTEAPEDGFLVRPDRMDFAKKMAVVDDLANRYRNALRELAK
jgi:putative addiction module antidote